MKNIGIVEIELVKLFNKLVRKYNNKEGGINYTDIRDFEGYIKLKGIDLKKVNAIINA